MKTLSLLSINMIKTRISSSVIFKILALNLLLLSATQIASGQSFILDLQYNPMSFTNAARTIINDPGNNGGLNQGSIHKYTDVATVNGITIYALLTILEVDNATIKNFDDDIETGDSDRFQPRIGAGSGGGHILYQLEFFNTANDDPAFLYNYWFTGVDVDGSSSASGYREFAELGGYTSYQVDASTMLTISTNPVTGRTRFLGRQGSLSGVTFDNTASYIANFSNPNNTITFALGVSEYNNERYFSIQLGAPDPEGPFDNPVTINNPLPIAVDDVGTTIYSSVGGTSVSNVLDNDLFDGSPVVPSAVNISVVDPASNPGVVLNTSTGEVTVAPGTPTGTYTIIYQICMVASPSDCDVATITVEVLQMEADLAVTKTGTPNPAAVGQTITYTIAVTNNGPNDAVDVEVEDILHSELTFVSAIPSTGTWSAPTWEIGTMANSASETLTITATVNTGVIGTVSNTATVSSNTTDPNSANNSATALITVESSGPINNHFPAAGFGTLAFEDLWPAKGDYDFNDLVLDYQFEITTNTGNMVEQVVGTFIIQAFGAGFENGFGFQLSDAINPTDLTVTGYSLTETYITLEGNGTEAGQSKPTIIVYDNAFNEMEHPGMGIGVNTEPSAPYVTPVTLTITITFPTDTYSYNDLNIASFNPFLIVNLDRSVEVHLPDYLPTDLADLGLFGTLEDDTNPATGKYYKTENNLPWAIHLYESFEYPIEKREINTAYNHFIEWAESGGSTYTDWYQDLSGYRNDSNIY